MTVALRASKTITNNLRVFEREEHLLLKWYTTLYFRLISKVKTVGVVYLFKARIFTKNSTIFDAHRIFLVLGGFLLLGEFPQLTSPCNFTTPLNYDTLSFVSLKLFLFFLMINSGQFITHLFFVRIKFLSVFLTTITEGRQDKDIEFSLNHYFSNIIECCV